MKWLAVLNPHAGHHPGDWWRSLARRVQATLDADVAWTAYPWHAAEIVRRHERYDGFLAAGGDGTVTEVVAGMDLGQLQYLSRTSCSAQKSSTSSFSRARFVAITN